MDSSGFLHTVSRLNDEIEEQNDEFFSKFGVWFSYYSNGNQDIIYFGDIIMFDSEDGIYPSNLEGLRIIVLTNFYNLARQMTKLKFE